MTMGRRIPYYVVLGLGCLATGCGASQSGARPIDTSTSAPSAPHVSFPPVDLYKPPEPLDPAPPGTLIWAEQVGGLQLNPAASVWRILYHSRDRDDRDIAVSGFAIVPTAEIPAGGRQVYVWAHRTVGLGDQCAPSHEIRDNLPPYGGQQLERGAVLVATDYEGLGTPGVPTSTVAAAEGHAVLDSVRAVADLPNVGSLGTVVLAGHSQGGRAALVAAEIAPEYAPELRVVGALALAPGVELPALVDHLVASPGADGIALIGAIGLRAGYPELDLSTTYTTSALDDIARIETECLDDTFARYQELPTTDVIRRAPSDLPDLQAMLEANSPGAIVPTVPVFLAHGDADEQVPVALSGRLEAKYCALGVTVARSVYPGVGHDEIIDAATKDALAFINDRFDDQPATTVC